MRSTEGLYYSRLDHVRAFAAYLVFMWHFLHMTPNYPVPYASAPIFPFALFDLLYVKVLNPGWADEYYSHYIAQARKDTPADQLPEKLQQIAEQREFWDKPHMLFLIMFATVFIIGTIVTIISALTLKRRRTVVA